MRSLLLVTVAAFSLPAAAVSQGRQNSDPLAAELAALKAQVTALAKRQAETEALLKEVSALLRQIEKASTTTGAGVSRPTDCAANQATQNQWLKFSVVGCASLGDAGRSMSLTITVKNITTSETLFIGARCCYAEWLKVVDDVGQSWEGTQSTVTRLPTYLDEDLMELAPGTEFSVNAVLKSNSAANSRSGLPTPPSTISISGELIRRSAADQRAIDVSTTRFRPEGQPITFGITGVGVARPR